MKTHANKRRGNEFKPGRDEYEMKFCPLRSISYSAISNEGGSGGGNGGPIRTPPNTVNLKIDEIELETGMRTFQREFV